MGFIETPYRKVRTGKVVMKDEVYPQCRRRRCKHIAQSNAELTETETSFKFDRKVTAPGRLPHCRSPDEVEYMDVAPNQIVGVRHP